VPTSTKAATNMSTTGSSFTSTQTAAITSNAMSIVFGASSNRTTRGGTGGGGEDLSGGGEGFIRVGLGGNWGFSARCSGERGGWKFSAAPGVRQVPEPHFHPAERTAGPGGSLGRIGGSGRAVTMRRVRIPCSMLDVPSPTAPLVLTMEPSPHGADGGKTPAGTPAGGQQAALRLQPDCFVAVLGTTLLGQSSRAHCVISSWDKVCEARSGRRSRCAEGGRGGFFMMRATLNDGPADSWSWTGEKTESGP